MIKVDTNALTSVINQCFAYSTDGRVSPADQATFLADGKRLRGLLLNLLSAQFNDGTQGVLDANKQLTAVNTELSDSATVFADTAQTLNSVASLVGNVDKLLNIASSFV
jgi:geranylgeranyl pyrophosphate synthase